MAAVNASLTIKGLSELDRALAELPDKVEEHVMAVALRDAGLVIHRAAVANIPKRSGRTAADLRLAVQQPATDQGVAAVGGTTGKDGRAFILRFLEMGTKAHKIVAGSNERRQARQAAKALAAIGQKSAARALRKRVREGGIRMRKALRMPGPTFRRSVNHPGSPVLSPLTRALFENGPRAIDVFRRALWAGIVKQARTLKQPA
jgi:hypothetical protein